MQELVRFMAQSLVDNPDEVSVITIETSDTVTVELRVAPDDMGKVIGKQGRIAKAMRSVLKAASRQESRRVMLEIMDS